MTDNWYFYKYDRNVRKILQEYPTIYSMADWIDIYFISENKIILKTIAHEEICYGTAKLFRSLKTQQLARCQCFTSIVYQMNENANTTIVEEYNESKKTYRTGTV